MRLYDEPVRAAENDVLEWFWSRDLKPADICREAMGIAASLCVYTNQEIVTEEL